MKVSMLLVGMFVGVVKVLVILMGRESHRIGH
jgi:hypothetical protein